MKNILSYCLLFIFCSAISAHGQNRQLHPPTCKILQSNMILHNPPFSQCHASTLAVLKDGSLMVAFFGGAYEGAADVKIWGTRLRNGAWTDPFALADGSDEPILSRACWNPVLFRTFSGTLYLFYKVGKNPREWSGMIKHSDDEGITWSDPVRLPEGVIGPVKNKPVELANGKLLCPSSVETQADWKVQMELFDPVNDLWEIKKLDPENSFQMIQPTILSIGKSTFRILCRSKSNAVITSLSTDSGLTWSSFETLSLPNPNSGIDGLTLPDGSHLLVYNPLIKGALWVEGRNQLNLAWSADGLAWIDLLVLEKENKGEFSYPAIIQSSDGLIHISYTHNRTQIKYLKIKL